MGARRRGLWLRRGAKKRKTKLAGGIRKESNGVLKEEAPGGKCGKRKGVKRKAAAGLGKCRAA